MYPKFLKVFSFAIIFLFAHQLFAQEKIVLDTEDKKYSYAIGNKIGQQLAQQFSGQDDIELDALLQGLVDIISETDTLLSDEDGTEIIQQRHRKRLAEATAIADESAQMGAVFLEENMAKEGVITTSSGLQYTILESGKDDQDSPTTSDTVVVHYEGTLVNGTVFDSSYARGEPATFSLGSIIPGWQEVLQLMKPGDKWAVVVPSDLAYGDNGAGQFIGPNEILLFDIELLEVKKSAN